MGTYSDRIIPFASERWGQEKRQRGRVLEELYRNAILSDERHNPDPETRAYVPRNAPKARACLGAAAILHDYQGALIAALERRAHLPPVAARAIVAELLDALAVREDREEEEHAVRAEVTIPCYSEPTIEIRISPAPAWPPEKHGVRRVYLWDGSVGTSASWSEDLGIHDTRHSWRDAVSEERQIEIAEAIAAWVAEEGGDGDA